MGPASRWRPVVSKLTEQQPRSSPVSFLFKKYLPGWIKLITLLPSLRVPTRPEDLNMERWWEAWGCPMHKDRTISETLFSPLSSNWTIFNLVSSPSAWRRTGSMFHPPVPSGFWHIPRNLWCALPYNQVYWLLLSRSSLNPSPLLKNYEPRDFGPTEMGRALCGYDVPLHPCPG